MALDPYHIIDHSILFDLAFAQRPPYPHDHCPAHYTRQGYSGRPGENWNWWNVQSYCHHARRILCPLCCKLVAVPWTVGGRKHRRVCLLTHPQSDSGSCFPRLQSSERFLIRWRIEQVIAPLLIIMRAANRTALASNTFASVHISEFKARTREEFTGGGGALPGGDPVGSADDHVTNSHEFGVCVRTTGIDSHQDDI